MKSRARYAKRMAPILLGVAMLCLCAACGGGNYSGTTQNQIAIPPAPAPQVTIEPTSATVPVGTLQQFYGFAAGTASNAVSWTATAGTIDNSGLYTAPASLPADGTATVTATSVSNPSLSASAVVSITTQPVTVSLSPASANVKAGFSQPFQATVEGTTYNSVTFSVIAPPGFVGGIGFISAGSYTAPAPVLANETFSVVATSNADPTKSASATVNVSPLENEELQPFPIKLGASGVNANSGCCSGTLGSLLTDQNGQQYILSNNHILGRVSDASAGEAIVQPGFVDTLCDFTRPNTVAHFTAAPDIVRSNVDAAIAEVVPGAVTPDGAIIGLGGTASDGSYIAAPPAKTVANAILGMLVAKSGRTSGLTCGTVEALDGDLEIDFPADCGNPTERQILFQGQVAISNLAQPGDSGSLIVDAASSRPVGLLAGITDDQLFTTANPIGDVLAALGSSATLNLSFVGGGEHSVSCPSTGTATQLQTSGKETKPGEKEVFSPEEILQAMMTKRKYETPAMRDPAVLGMAVGRSATQRGRVAIWVFVERGHTLSNPLPGNFDGVEVRLVPTARFKSQGGPALSGAKCGPPSLLDNTGIDFHSRESVSRDPRSSGANR